MLVATLRRPTRPVARLLTQALAPIALTLAAACSTEPGRLTAPEARAPMFAAAVVTTTTYALSSVTPPISCTDASGATTTVTGGSLVLASNGRFTATFTTATTSADGSTTTTSSYTEKGTFTQSGSTITFKSGGKTYVGTLDNGTLTIADYPLCGTTHTAVFVQS